MTAIIASTLLVFSAPLIFWWALSYGSTYHFLNRILMVVLAGFVLLRLLPDTYSQSGWLGLFLAFMGFALPSLAEFIWRRAQAASDKLMFAIGYLGFAFHIFIDGHTIALFDRAEFTEPWIKWLLVSHRLPESLIIWWACFPRLGWRLSLWVLCSIAGTSIGGYLIGGMYAITPDWTNTVSWVSQSLLAGSLLHLVFHRLPTNR